MKYLDSLISLLNHSTLSKLFAICVASVFLSACTISPENEEWVALNDLNFSGYAENPGATIEVQAYDQSRNIWTTVRTTTANDSATTFGGESVYSWKIENFDFTTIDNWDCYWGFRGYCSISPGAAIAKFRFRELGSSIAYLMTYDKDDVANCLLPRVIDGENLFAAGLECRSSTYPVVTLKILT